MMKGLGNMTSKDGWKDLELFSLKPRVCFFLMQSHVVEKK